MQSNQNATKPAVCTIFCKNYLAQARCFYESFRCFNPTIPFFALMVDRPDGLFIPSQEPFEILDPIKLGLPYLRSVFFDKDLQGACCTLKPFLLRHLLDQGFGPVMFMDPDVLVLDDLTAAFAQVSGSAVALTPHYLSPPLGDDRIALELRLLRSGTFNGAFVGVSNAPDTFEFLDWWGNRLRTFCERDPGAGIHYDQRWLDLAPSLFSNVQVLRDPGLNVAYWNFIQRSFRADDIGAFVGMHRCRFFHFSGYVPSEPERLTRFDDLSPVSETPAASILARYRSALMSHGWLETHAWPYSYARFSNGDEIVPLVRDIHAARSLALSFGDPFQAELPGGLYRYLCGRPDGRVTPRLWQEIYDRRPDLRLHFPDIENADRDNFAAWIAMFASSEYGLPDQILKNCAVS